MLRRMEPQRTFFRLCSSCKKELPFERPYYVCSVSTCNRKRMALTFCSLPCFEAHVPTVRHREAWAEERRAPTREQYERELAEEREAEQASEAREREPAPAPAAAAAQPRRIVPTGGRPAALSDSGVERDILIVVSKLKAYVRARSGLNTSDGVAEVLSDIVRELCDAAVQKAIADGRKTLMDRDF
jgi:hypothetical protein